MRKAAAALLLLGLATAQPHAQEPARQQLHLSLQQGQVMAAHALNSGNPQLALRITNALLQADRKNHSAWHLQAAAHAQTGNPGQGRKSAARAFRFAQDDGSKYQMAQLASRLAFQGGSPTLSQYWLRRTAIYAPDDKAEKLIAKDYETLRRINPWAFRLSGGVKPSSNVNNGSDTSISIIDGVPETGSLLNPRSIALSGLVSTIDTSLGRRLRQSSTSETRLSGRLHLQRVALSPSAKSEAAAIVAARPGLPMPRNSDFASTYAELSLSHAFATGAPGSGGSARLALTAATSWYGGEKSYDLIKSSASRSWQLSQSNRISIFGSAEDRLNPRSAGYDANVYSLGASFSRTLFGGNVLNFTLGLRDNRSKFVNTTYKTATFRIGYDFEKPFGPAKVSSGLILGQSEYSAFLNPIEGALLPKGRQDQSLYADLNLFFEDYDYAGFAPMMRVRAGKRMSNLSLYAGTEFSVSLGIESKF